MGVCVYAHTQRIFNIPIPKWRSLLHLSNKNCDKSTCMYCNLGGGGGGGGGGGRGSECDCIRSINHY